MYFLLLAAIVGLGILGPRSVKGASTIILILMAIFHAAAAIAIAVQLLVYIVMFIAYKIKKSHYAPLVDMYTRGWRRLRDSRARAKQILHQWELDVIAGKNAPTPSRYVIEMADDDDEPRPRDVYELLIRTNNIPENMRQIVDILSEKNVPPIHELWDLD